VGWKLISVDSEETGSVDGAATNAFDGDVSTFWHTQLQGSNPRPPHRIDIDLGAVHDLDGFRYLPRQDGGVDGRVEIYTFYVSMDGVSWGRAVAAGTFRNNAQEQEVAFVLTQGRYIRFQALTEENGQPWTSMAELNLLGTAASGVNMEPNGVIDTPGDGATVEVGGALNFSGSGSDPDSNALLSYRWTFGDPTVADMTLKDPPDVMFNTPGTHTVALTAVDHLGLADSTPATIQVTVNAPSATGGISVDSEETSSEGLIVALSDSFETVSPDPIGEADPFNFKLSITQPTGPLIESGPLIINGESDVVISGLHISNPNGSCIEIRNGALNVVIENSEIGPCGKKGIDILNSSHITINNNHIHDAVAEGIMSYSSHDIAVDSNVIENVQSGYEMWKTRDGNLSFTNNFVKNVSRGNKNGGNVVQIAFVHAGGIRVTDNIAVNILGQSNPEDLINVYSSDGTPDDPIQIKRNRFNGGGPRLSSGGIILGDQGGSYQIAEDNILVNPGQYGLQIGGGHHHTFRNNLVYSDDQRSFTNVGVIIWRYGSGTAPGECHSHTVEFNEITWWRGPNYKNKGNEPWLAPHYNPSFGSDKIKPNCGDAVGWRTNKFDTKQNQPADLDESLWHQEWSNPKEMLPGNPLFKRR
jgi:hypothetical protein